MSAGTSYRLSAISSRLEGAILSGCGLTADSSSREDLLGLGENALGGDRSPGQLRVLAQESLLLFGRGLGDDDSQAHHEVSAAPAAQSSEAAAVEAHLRARLRAPGDNELFFPFESRRRHFAAEDQRR